MVCARARSKLFSDCGVEELSTIVLVMVSFWPWKVCMKIPLFFILLTSLG